MSESGASSRRPIHSHARSRRRGNPVHERGRLGRFWGGLEDYVRTAWWGLVSPRLSEPRPLEIVQGVILRSVTREGAAGHTGESGSEADRVEVLLSIRSDLFGWELPGGTPELGETPEESLRREVMEETGLDVTIEGHVGDWVRKGFRPHRAKIYRCRVEGGIETPSHETPRVAWFEVEELPMELFPWYRDPLRRALEPISSPLEITERQGITSIWAAMKIDLSLRWRGLPTPPP